MGGRSPPRPCFRGNPLLARASGFPFCYSFPMSAKRIRAEYIALLERAHTDDAPFEAFIAERVLETQKDMLRMLA